MKKTDSASSLVCGLGQVGIAITSILECDGIDKNQIAPAKNYKYLHICFPYNSEFIKQVRYYQFLYSPDYIVCHSTVPVGTCKKLNMVHSPVRGKHPDLEKSIRTFVKYFGGDDAYACAQAFQEKGVKVKCLKYSQDSEAGKLFDTLIYGVNILIEKEIHEFCKNNSLNFDMVYTNFCETYNEGYEEMGLPQFKKYILKHVDGPIGGHCLLSNAELLDTPFAKLLCKSSKG